jgi:hypothetical protein
MIRYLIALLLLSFSINAETINTGNILTNSTFGTGNTTTTTGWSTSGDDGIHTHGEWGFPYQTGMDDTGGVLAFEGHEEDNVYQDVDLVGDGHLTQSEINQGFTSTMSADVWFWNSIENTFTLKQTVTSSDGSVSTQVRDINDHDPSRPGNGGTFTNYTNVYTQGSNTQTDFTVRAEVYNETAGTTYDGSHRGPDVDNITLNIGYQYIPPINEETQDVIDDIDQDIIDIVEDLPEDFDWNNDEYVWEDEYTWEEEEYTWEDEYSFEDEYVIIDEGFNDDFYFEEELETIDFDMDVFEEPPMFEDFNTEDMPSMEEVFFEEEFMEEPPMMTEELFTEEFEEDFTSFIEETGMEEEFEQFLEEEGITAEEFFEEITEEEFNDELTEESFDEFEEPMEKVATNEESVPEVIEDKEEAMEEPNKTESIEEEKEVASNEQAETKSEEKTESDSKGTEESEVSTEDGGEQEDIQSEGKGELDTDTNVSTTVAKVESKLKENLKKVAKQIAEATKQNTENLSKEDLFFKSNTLNAYLKTDFYKSKDIYTDTNLDFFNQIDLGVYSKDIYTTVSLNSYVSNDPVEVHKKNIQKINTKKRQLLAELEALKNE